MSHRFGPDVVLDQPGYIHETALIFGKVYIGPGATVWPNVVMRAEMFEIRIGARTNIQDFCMVHVGAQTPTVVGEDCSITHHATLHGCEIGDRVLVGINATLMDGVKVGSNSIIAGHSILSEGSEFPENSIIGGTPARLIKTRDCGEANLINATFYSENGKNYAKGLHRMDPKQLEAAVKNRQHGSE